MEKGYKKLIVWQKADQLAIEIYGATMNFPKEEIYGITSQLRRAALSVPTNIVEGMGRQGLRETKQFVNLALGSLFETEYLLEFSQKLRYLDKTSFDSLDSIRHEVGKLLWGLYKSI